MSNNLAYDQLPVPEEPLVAYLQFRLESSLDFANVVWIALNQEDSVDFLSQNAGITRESSRQILQQSEKYREIWFQYQVYDVNHDWN